MESGNRAPVPVNVRANVARVLLDALATQCKSYCILSGYERLPENFDTDIDFMVDQEDFDRMPRIIEEVARKTGTKLFQSIDHELTGRAYFLGSMRWTRADHRAAGLRRGLSPFRPALASGQRSARGAPPPSQRVLHSFDGARVCLFPHQAPEQAELQPGARLQTASPLCRRPDRVRPDDCAVLPGPRGVGDRAHGLGQ